MSCNGIELEVFCIIGGVHQGCPLTPYLFLFVGEVLNIATKHLVEANIVKDIMLPNKEGQQTIIQYVEDINFTVAGTEGNIRALTLLFERFKTASELQINWDKSVAYWMSNNPLPWLEGMPFQWVQERCISKLLGIPLGLICLSLI